MDIETSSNTIKIRGNIKSVADYQKIKVAFERMTHEHKNILLDIQDSISITSSVIGYLTKLVQKDGIDLSISVGSESLMELFDDLNLVALFKVKKV